MNDEQVNTAVQSDNFWTALPKSFFALAPMEDVTDTVFREVILSVSDPKRLHVLFTEFTSTDGMCHSVGRQKVSHRLRVNTSERELLRQMGVKLVVQIWGSDPKKFYETAKILSAEYDFDGIDINMGCPVKKIVKQASCSALIKFPELAQEIIYATKEGTHLPVSVKTRMGFDSVITEAWIATLLETKPAAIALHGRIQKDQSAVPANWLEIAKAAALSHSSLPNVVFMGNGDIAGYEDGLLKQQQSQVDGLMVGRGIFADPWMFAPPGFVPTIANRLDLLQKHVHLYEQTWGAGKNFNILKRFFKIYANNFTGAAALRASLMQCQNGNDAYKALEEFTIPT